MDVRLVGRRLGGALGNAVAWGVAWFVLAFTLILTLRTLGIINVPANVTVVDALGMAIKFGVMGGIVGGAFALAIGVLYRGRRLAEISAVRFGLGGGLVAGLFVPVFLVLANLLTGGGVVPFAAIRGDAVSAALFGGIAAGASMWLAQRGAPASDDDATEPAFARGAAPPALGVGAPGFVPAADRKRAAEPRDARRTR